MSFLIDTLLERVATIIAIVTAVVVFVSWTTVRIARMRRGRPERRYISWFLRRHGTYWNPYLDASERLDLESTCVPLSLVEGQAEGNALLSATTVMGDRTAGNMILVGDAGSGKTTALKAYGVATLRHRSSGVVQTPPSNQVEIPFFVPIAMLATMLHQGGLASYLKAEILQAGAGLTPDEAHRFLAQVLKQKRCVILLDGLDEIGRDSYPALHRAVHRFALDNSAELPTRNARLVITCRRYNFLRMQQDWIGGAQRLFGDTFYSLAPLSEAEIFQYLHNLRGRFRRDDGPEYFMAALHTSETLNLHRTPLVLAMSVGLYAGREFFEIPHSIAELYDAMIKEMLDRRRSPDTDGGIGGVLHYLRDDKLRLLREFSLHAAQGPTGFNSFDLSSLNALAKQMQPALQRVPEGQVGPFVEEIVETSGLLSTLPDQRYEYAHRSIQEHLAAAELVRSGDDGATALLNWAKSRDWRQVVLFFAAEASQRVVTPFLDELARRDLVLAGGCLAGADCRDEIAIPILNGLAKTLRNADRETVLLAFSALVGATASPRSTIQAAAKELIYNSLSGAVDHSGALNALGGDIDAMVDIITLLIDRMDQADVNAHLIARLTAPIPNDPRLIRPLWRFLCSPSTQRRIEAGHTIDDPIEQLVEQLLMLATEPACFMALQRQPAPISSFVTTDMRRKVYPFKNGLELSDNLVTVLCWAERLNLAAPHLNRFLKAKASNPVAWARIEADRDRSGLSIRIPPYPRFYRTSRKPVDELIGLALSLLALVVIGTVAADFLRVDPLLGFGVRLTVLLLAIAGLGLAVSMFGVGARAHPGRRIRLWRTNPFVDIYDDSGSRHWMGVFEPPSVTS
jgi:NACHT domain-containing protein